MKLIISGVIFEPPPPCPKRPSKQSYYRNLPPWNICNILFILILCCDLCPCSLSHHSVRQFVVDFMRTVFGHRKKQGEDVFFSSFTLLLVCLRRYVGVVTTLRCYDCYTAESYDTSWSSTSCNCSFCSVSPSPCMSEVQSVRLSRRSCMISVESL